MNERWRDCSIVCDWGNSMYRPIMPDYIYGCIPDGIQ